MAAQERHTRERSAERDYYARNFPTVNAYPNERGQYAVIGKSGADVKRRLMAMVTGDEDSFNEKFPIVRCHLLARPRTLKVV